MLFCLSVGDPGGGSGFDSLGVYTPGLVALCWCDVSVSVLCWILVLVRWGCILVWLVNGVVLVSGFLSPCQRGNFVSVSTSALLSCVCLLCNWVG